MDNQVCIVDNSEIYSDKGWPVLMAGALDTTSALPVGQVPYSQGKKCATEVPDFKYLSCDGSSTVLFSPRLHNEQKSLHQHQRHHLY